MVTALTGVAATNIKGETTHSAVGFNRYETKMEDIAAYANARLLIIDEVSFLQSADLSKIDARLRKLMEKPQSHYGGLNVLFCGDFHQLPPIGGDSIYVRYNQLWHGAINSFIELSGSWRFKEDPEWGALLNRFRNGVPTQEDFNTLDSRVVKSYVQQCLLLSNQKYYFTKTVLCPLLFPSLQAMRSCHSKSITPVTEIKKETPFMRAFFLNISRTHIPRTILSYHRCTPS